MNLQLTILLTKRIMTERSIRGSIFAIICGLMTVTFGVIMKNKRKGWSSCQAEKNETDVKQREVESKIKFTIDDKKHSSLEDKVDHTVIPDLQDPKWILIGKVTNLHAYPLISGKEYAVDECKVNYKEMNMFEESIQMKCDRSFVVFDNLTKYIITSKTIPTLSEVSLSFEHNHLILQAAKMPTLCTELNQSAIVKCDYWCSTKMITVPRLICIDCGDEAAKWLSRFLKEKDDGVRLGYITNSLYLMSTFWHTWARDCIIYRKSLRNEYNLDPFVNILNSILISTVQYEKMSEKFETYGQDMKYCPNIIISTSNLYIGKIWKWIKIGNVIIKNSSLYQTWPK
ncbi:mitochondrial amidoxime-reducing component 1-like isoform X2 [Harpegnathos saltator]|nr:mitochondrial amidoxime-reducing component 1-like isoform X2 [Harpegnathos saltator]